MEDRYGGSRFLDGAARHIGLPVDQMNFVVSQIAALGLAAVFRTALAPGRAGPAARHAFGLVFGLWTGFFCFGYQAVHLAGLPAVCYVVIITQSPRVIHSMVLAVSLVYLSALHIHRQIYDYGSYSLDISGPLMVITQKVTSLAFSIHDGLTKNDEDLSRSQSFYAVKKIPSILEYFSYTLMFPSIMAGPVIFYRDYIDFIEGKQYKCSNAENTKTIVIEPNPTKFVVKKVLFGTTCAFIFINFLPKFPISRVKDDSFIENTTFSYKLWYLTVSTTLVRFKYYFAWILADAICNNCGLGYNAATGKWDKISNVDIFSFEFGTSLKQSIGAWNKGTNKWLRMIVYDRVKSQATVLTYTLSAIWHGFYPGYYLTFFSGAFFTFASRIMRRTLRDHFAGSAESKLFYDVLTFMVTRFVLAYITFPFVLLEFWPSIRLFNKLNWVLHFCGVLAVLVIPRIVPKASNREARCEKTGIALALRQAGPFSTQVGHKTQ